MFRLVAGRMKFYAVHIGRVPGVYKSWAECQTQVAKYTGAKFKKFSTFDEASYFVNIGVEKENDKDFLMQMFKEELSCDKDDSEIAKSPENSILTRKRKAKSEHSAGAAKVKKLSEPKYESDANESSCPVIYTDGACSKNGKKGSKAGYGVWWGDGHELNFCARLPGIQTNQRAEIAAVNKAIKQAIDVGHQEVLIRTDSKFVINCLTEWAGTWSRNNWTKRDGSSVVHKTE
uniref:ribonuclease H n=1 Tax=Ciona savignyi TaxID=51511 RepID=H2Y3W3_CIOSA